jgi:hypothetical protein
MYLSPGFYAVTAAPLISRPFYIQKGTVPSAIIHVFFISYLDTRNSTGPKKRTLLPALHLRWRPSFREGFLTPKMTLIREKPAPLFWDIADSLSARFAAGNDR